ncbi:hypothetical protein SUGI_0873000 [Cryptomeria japonica]|uniref:blue copper protein 1a-like n=1 Tax=Cryptomeria japonica TaxID=3369 RepID=UPI0024147267|nr:blue copper protein 1a-like [Cryptomeria japonica]GLJ42155.1 hypothetical protein SUGI_0873000 [Cryptomeria japonica]
MATKSLVSFITLATLSLTIMICDPVNAANVFTVGDEKGWTLGFDYQAWAQDKQFHIGDRLVFNYPKGVHNVLVVNGSSFANCVKEPIFPRLESGHDVLEFIGTGNVWFICGVGMHCQNGLKLKITITDQSSPAPAAAPSSEENWHTSSLSSVYHLKPW